MGDDFAYSGSHYERATDAIAAALEGVRETQRERAASVNAQIATAEAILHAANALIAVRDELRSLKPRTSMGSVTRDTPVGSFERPDDMLAAAIDAGIIDRRRVPYNWSPPYRRVAEREGTIGDFADELERFNMRAQ